jgi:hypothetical protein
LGTRGRSGVSIQRIRESSQTRRLSRQLRQERPTSWLLPCGRTHFIQIHLQLDGSWQSS